MTIIPQDIINNAKNLIEEKFLFEVKYLFKDFINDLFYSFSEFKYTSLVLSFNKKIVNLLLIH